MERSLFDAPPRFNIAPTQTIAAVLVDGGVRTMRGAAWGLVPRWAAADASGAATLSALLLPFEFAFWIGFALPFGPLLGIVRTVLLLMA